MYTTQHCEAQQHARELNNTSSAPQPPPPPPPPPVIIPVQLYGFVHPTRKSPLGAATAPVAAAAAHTIIKQAFCVFVHPTRKSPQAAAAAAAALVAAAAPATAAAHMTFF